MVPLCWNPEHDFFRGHIQCVTDDCESRNVLFGHDAGGRIEQIEPTIGREAIIQRDAQKAIFDLRFHVDMPGEDNGGVLRLPDFNVTGAFDVKDTSVRRDGEFQRIGWRAVQDHLLVIGIDGRTRIRIFDAGGELDSAQQMGLKKRLGEAFGRVTTGGVPGAPAVVEMRPGDRVIEAKRASAVAGLIQGGQDVDRRSGVDVKVIPLISPDPALGQHAA